MRWWCQLLSSLVSLCYDMSWGLLAILRVETSWVVISCRFHIHLSLRRWWSYGLIAPTTIVTYIVVVPSSRQPFLVVYTQLMACLLQLQNLPHYVFEPLHPSVNLLLITLIVIYHTSNVLLECFFSQSLKLIELFLKVRDGWVSECFPLTIRSFSFLEAYSCILLISSSK